MWSQKNGIIIICFLYSANCKGNNLEESSMCGRFVIFSEEENEEIRKIINEINSRLNPEEAVKFKTGEICPTDHVPIIAAAGTKKVIGLAKFGFPNYKNNSVIINARSETLEEKPTFRNILSSKRCIIPASGYYEWKKTDNKKEKFLIRINKPLLYMAGLYNSFIDKNNNQYTGFVIITTEASRSIAHIHDRMPVILAQETINEWLTGSDIKKMFIPYSDDSMVVSRVG
jgi:putative SOS response-associated peptidase YedK